MFLSMSMVVNLSLADKADQKRVRKNLFQFRVGNMRLSHLIETHVGAQLIHHKRTTKEGESVSYDMEELSLNTQTFFGRSEFDDSDSDDGDSKDEEPSRVRMKPTLAPRKKS